MKVLRSSSTEEIKEKFNMAFPKLKIEFYKGKHGHYDLSSNSLLIDGETILSKLSTEMKDGVVDLDSKITVDEFESLFESKFGLHIQVFRKSGEQWMQTSVTDDWTLEKQESRAEESERMKESD